MDDEPLVAPSARPAEPVETVDDLIELERLEAELVELDTELQMLDAPSERLSSSQGFVNPSA